MTNLGVGMFVAIMIGVAIGKPLVDEHSRRHGHGVLLAVISCTILAGLSIGWALNTWWAMIGILPTYRPMP